MTEKWQYYNHAAIPKTAPHELPDLQPIEDGSIWNIDGKHPLLARWTTDFDCGHETNWWYVIKDTPFDISELKAKRRYEINKGKRNFRVSRINPQEYVESMFQVMQKAYMTYPAKYRPHLAMNDFEKMLKECNKEEFFGAFSRESDLLCGYAIINLCPQYINFNVLKVDPTLEKMAINAAIVAEILECYNEKLGTSVYICDGSRNVVHETYFQDYLEKYFGFRKAFCKLHIRYNPRLKFIIPILNLFPNFLKKLDSIKIVHQINGILRMDEYAKDSIR